MSDTVPRDRHWEVDGLRLAGLEWGPLDGIPVLALHGWIDHAESFSELAPRLKGCHVIALDLSGQGLSAHRATHATYNIWDDLPQISEVMDQVGWSSCVLLGHSRGANISALFAAAQPTRVRAFVALDSLAPEPVEDETFVATLRAFVEQTRRQKSRAPRYFATPEEYVARRQQQGNALEVSQALAARALKQTQDGYVMRGDPKLFASSAVKLTQANVEAVLKAIECPVLNIWASDGIMRRRPKLEALARLGQSWIKDYKSVQIAGDHHFHLDPAAASEIAKCILDFLEQKDIRPALSPSPR